MSIKVISLFSGGGGLDLGFMNAGYEIVWAIDNDPNAVETYKRNIGKHIICEDINKIDIGTLPEAEVVIGGPPCQSFSLAGKRETEDHRGQLVWTYLNFIKHISPKAFLFENVTGLLSAKNKNGEKIIDLLINTFSNIGYDVEMKVINAADFGVPQRRKRVLIVGLKKGSKFVFPKPRYSEFGQKLPKYISVDDALSDLPPAIDDPNGLVNYMVPPKNDFQRKMRTNGSVSEHFIPKTSKLDEFIIFHVKPGGNYMDVPSTVNSARIRRLQTEGGHTTCYGRLLPSSPSYTINTYFNRPNVGCNIHYKENRLITVREALRLQSFPDSFVIVSKTKQGRNTIVGNAVPPLLSELFANELKKYIW